MACFSEDGSEDGYSEDPTDLADRIGRARRLARLFRADGAHHALPTEANKDALPMPASTKCAAAVLR